MPRGDCAPHSGIGLRLEPGFLLCISPETLRVIDHHNCHHSAKDCRNNKMENGTLIRHRLKMRSEMAGARGPLSHLPHVHLT
jgi:hypothetical protein